VVLNIPPALTILQILAIDLGTDMVPALALGADPPETGIMQQGPRTKNQPLLDRWLLIRAYAFLGVIEAIAGMVGFFVVWWSHGYSLAEMQLVTPAILNHSATSAVTQVYHQATTMTVAAIVACQAGNVFACRSEWVSIFKLGFFSNPWIWLGIGVEWTLILLIIQVSSLQQVFSTASLAPWQWLALLLCPPLLLSAEELRKRLFIILSN
jgi:Ca2+-transporting ATPase